MTETTIVIGGTYTVVQPEPDPTCDSRGCELHQPDLLFPWFHVWGKRVTVTETGLTYEGHPAVRVAYGKVDWNPKVAVTLTDEQVKALGIPTTGDGTYLITGHLWGVLGDYPVPTAITDTDEFPYGAVTPVEMPRQQTEIIPSCCLASTAKPPVPPEVRRREARLRRLAAKQGFTLRKTRVQAPYPAGSTGPYLLLDPARAKILPWSSWDVGLGRGLSLDAVEAALQGKPEPQPGPGIPAYRDGAA